MRPSSVQYHCDYCQKDISNVVRIRCAICKDFDLCLECFSVGVEIKEHKNDHDYKIMDYMSFPLFEEGWGADEELLLLEAIQMYGIGNWSEISEHVGTTKSPEICRDHYFTVYIQSATSPEPDTTKTLTTDLKEYLRTRLGRHQSPSFAEPEPPASSALSQGQGSKTTSKTNQKKKVKHNVSCPIAAPDQAGYMPKRKEFETEWNNDAECLIADIVLEDEDDDEIRDLKGSALEVYNRRLDERLYRRAFVIENDLVEQKKKQAAAKEKKSKEEIQEEREISRAMQKFLQLQGKGEHEPFIDGLVQESLLRKRIMQLQEWRKMGIKTLIEGEVYEKEKARREAEKGRMTRGVANSIYAMERTGVRGSKWINRHNAIPWDLLTDDKDKKKGKLTRKQAPLDLTGAPKLECLSLKERELCGALRLYPQQYVLIKETLIRESLRHGGQMPKALARKLIKIDTPRVNRIYEFIEKSGWIAAPAPNKKLS